MAPSVLNSMKWIMFLEEGHNLENFFIDTNIPFDCEFLVAQQRGEQTVALTEVYRINSKLPLQMNAFGEWTEEHGLKGSKHSLYYRRNNLHGTTIRVGYFNDAGTTVIQRDPELRPLVLGYFGEAWSTLEDQINFISEYHQSEDRAFGAIGENGNWSGLMGMVIRNETDVAVQSMTVITERSQFVDFLMPLLRSSQGIVIKKPDRRLFRWNNFLRPFSQELWLGVIVCMAVLTLFLSATCHIRRIFSPEEEISEFGITESFAYVFTSFCQQGCATNPSAVSSRVICIVIKLTATVLLGGYSAYLIANLAVNKTVLPFTDLESLLEDGTYELGLLANSYTVMYYKNTNDPIRQSIYRDLIAPHILPTTEYQAMQWICSKEKYAFLGVIDTFFNQDVRFNCRIITAWKSDWRNDLAISISKGNPYRGIFESTLHRMRITGVLQRLKLKSWRTAHQEEKKLWESVPLQAVGAIMLIPLFGTFLSVCVLLCEIIIQRKAHKYNERYHRSK